MEHKIDSKTHLYGIFGNPIEHSLSPVLHNAVFKQLGMNSVYMAFCVESESLGLAFEGMRALGIKGVNITIPFKEDALNYLDEVPEDLDRLIGAVNTVVNKDGQLFGYNTDGPGFILALHEELSFRVEGKDVLVIGAGGAARAVVFALAKAGAERIFILNRTRERGEGLAEYTGGHFPETDIAYLESIQDLPPKKLDLVVNTTSCGMKGNTDLPLDWTLIQKPKAAYDLVYSPAQTPWLKEAGKLGIPHANGLGMLVNQAAIAFGLWTDKKEGVRGIMKEALSHWKT